MPSSNKIKRLLVSMNFESTKGGISRVARLIADAVVFDQVLSLYGNQKEENARYFNQSMWRFSLALFKIIFIQRPSLLVFDHVGPASLLFFVPDFLLKNRRIVIFLHDEEAWSVVNKRHAWGLDKATHILCNSQYTFERFIQKNPKYASKTCVCLLAGVPSTFLKNEENQLSAEYSEVLENAAYCIFVSRLWKEHRYKGHYELLEAYKHYCSKVSIPAFKMVFVGNGNDAENFKLEIDHAGLKNHAFLFSNVSDDALRRLYANTFALLFPSTREGFGFVFLEAMYFGKACVGVQGQPAEEIIIDGKSGVLMKDNAPQTIEEVLFEMDHNKEKYVQFGVEGKRIYNEKFRNEHFKERFLTCISSPI